MRLPSGVDHLVPKKTERRNIGKPARIDDATSAGGGAGSSSGGAENSGGGGALVASGAGRAAGRGDERTLFPDVPATLEAAERLIADGFTVLPYITDDPVACQRLEQLGCPAVMPLAAPIGSGMGIRNPANLRIIMETVEVPVIVDAGVGTASDAAYAMELGATALLMNTAIAHAKDPVKMARAMRQGVEAGRAAYEAGRMPKRLYASASSPLDGTASF